MEMVGHAELWVTAMEDAELRTRWVRCSDSGHVCGFRWIHGTEGAWVAVPGGRRDGRTGWAEPRRREQRHSWQQGGGGRWQAEEEEEDEAVSGAVIFRRGNGCGHAWQGIGCMAFVLEERRLGGLVAGVVRG